MEPQIPGNTSSSLDPTFKRKRGRPRKDENLASGDAVPAISEPENIKKVKHDACPFVTGGESMIGRVVEGVIDGKFDAGYFVKVKVGDTDTHLTGVVFLPGRYVPLTAANDLAPSAKMYQRTDIPIPFPNFQHQEHDAPSIAVMGNRQSAPEVSPLTSTLLASGNTVSSEGTGEQLKHMVSGTETLSASAGVKMEQDKAGEVNEVLQACALKGSPAIPQRVVDLSEIVCPTFDQSQIEASSIKDGAPEPAQKIVSGEPIAEPNGGPVVNAFQSTEAKTRGEVTTVSNLVVEGSQLQGTVASEFCATSGPAIAKVDLDTEPLTSSSAMLETQATMLDIEPVHEGFLLSKIAESGRCSSSGAAITKDGDMINAIPPTES